MCISILLGMGMPTSGVYVLLGILLGLGYLTKGTVYPITAVVGLLVLVLVVLAVVLFTPLLDRPIAVDAAPAMD